MADPSPTPDETDEEEETPSIDPLIDAQESEEAKVEIENDFA
jgi:hypothetical protein